MADEPRTLAAIAGALRARDVMAETLTRHCLDRIEAKNPALNAFITVLREDALAQARDADREPVLR